jgi:hypothetical protein
MTDKAPVIKPIKIKEFEFKQSKYKQCGSLPVRSILLGPSGAGKGVLLQNMILDIYKKCFERIYIFSPSINVDHTWLPVKKHISDTIDKKDNEPNFYYDSYDPESLEAIIESQTKIVEYQKKHNHNRIFQILIIVDDFADSPDFSRQSKLLHSLFTRGRHSGISTIVSTQKISAIHPIIRVNATELFVFRLRNYQDTSMFLEEMGGMIDKKTLLDIYKLATKEAYSFLYVKLNVKNLDNMFMINFTGKIKITDE